MQFRTSMRSAAMFAVCGATLASFSFVQAQTSAPTPAQGTPPAQKLPSSPTPLLAPPAPPPAPTFPKPNPAMFTADSPSVETIDAFLKASWGFDPNRMWQVEAVQKTTVPGLSKVLVAVAEKGSSQQAGNLQFFVLPDGKHLIAEDVLPFGAHPFEDTRKLLLDRATGPSKGAASKDLLFVELADFQCPHCKEAQGTVDKLLTDFPNAHFIFENYPLVEIHPEAYKAAAYGVCVDKDAGDAAFFKFADAIFADQASLTPEGADKALADAATKAGADAAKVAACSTAPAAKASVDASLKLAADLGANSTPTLYVNGRALPLGGPYDKLKDVINYQLTLDGLKSGVPASTP
jgi:protein-disulfide isomerase